MQHEPSPSDLAALQRERTLLTLRVLWGALLAGIGFLFLMMLSLWHKDAVPDSPPRIARGLGYAAVILLVTLVPLGYFIRNQTYKRYWQGDAIAPPGYLGGNLALFVLCSLAASVGLAATLVARTHGWHCLTAVPAVVAVAVLVINFPNGRAMVPAKSNS